MTSPTAHVVSVSGGKDSTALLLLALQRCPTGSVFPIFCDTGHEHQATYDYLDYLERELGVTITRLKADFSKEIARKRMFIARDQRTRRDAKGRKVRWSNKAKRRALAVLYPSGNPFLDLCLWKGRFPSRRAQFCTDFLKKQQAVAHQLDLVDQGYRVISWQGVRRDESHARRDAKLMQRLGPDMWAFRPLVEWTAADVFAFADSKGIRPNPLYLRGMSRVGCMPCINCGKEELREIAGRFASEIDRVERWELLVGQASKRGFSTLRHENGEAKDRREVFAKLNIRAAVEWSKTTHGGRQYDLLADNESGSQVCASAYGLCE